MGRGSEVIGLALIHKLAEKNNVVGLEQDGYPSCCYRHHSNYD